MGITLREINSLPFRGYLVDPGNDDAAQGIVYVDNAVAGRVVAIQYKSREDNAAISALFRALPHADFERPNQIALRAFAPELVIEKLKLHVPQYSRSQLAVESIALTNLFALSKLVRGYKYNQVRVLSQLYRDNRLGTYECAIADYGNSSTIATPPVVEEAGDRLVLIQGTTRCLHLLRSGAENVTCIVARGQTSPLPGPMRVKLKDVLIAGRAVSTEDRYAKSIDQEFRPIELATHYPSETLV
jgi:hypothetical protein